ncbi:hypothetical protein [Mucilaginibacter pedocola]|uniref:Uncharacterized protein n=1 Tax=Mucilaginibacter pedocola TaxID=1792845 RepID=A0A1S9PFX6_9SPHI|nr:hypothetical protein [Mucilaginibacter pedocola]OOQ59488.1 hypothetical protein BC343_04725 [Mucilaginibacter pedocola]
MAKIKPNTCTNCGATLIIESPVKSRCDYCGSVYNYDDAEERQEKEAAYNVRIKLSDSGPQTSFGQGFAEPPKKGFGCLKAILVFIAVIAAFFIYLIYFYIPRNVTNEPKVEEPPKKMTAVDSARAERRYGELYFLEIEEKALKLLEPIPLDSALFKKLYQNADRSKDEITQEISIYDKATYNSSRPNKIWLGMGRVSVTSRLYFNLEVTSKTNLYVEKAVFNVDGEEIVYKERFFSHSNTNGTVTESNTEDVAYKPEYIDLLVEIVTAEKASVKYEGDKGEKIVEITPAEKAGLKRQLQIFKGFLLKYPKR